MNLFELYEERKREFKGYKVGDKFKIGRHLARITSIDISNNLINCNVCDLGDYNRLNDDLIYFKHSFHISYFKRHFSPFKK